MPPRVSDPAARTASSDACSSHSIPWPRTAVVLGAAALFVVTGLAACGRSGGSSARPSSPAGATTGASGSNGSAAPSSSAGSFGSLKNICGPGNAKGATGRGVTATEINLATFSDTGNTFEPGLEQEFFDTGDAFVKWCNAAGGINGRAIVLHKRDAKLFNAAAVVLEACQTDFMEVGGGTALDDATVKPRLACGLGDIPAYHVSPTAVQAGLQVEIGAAPATQANISGFRLLGQVDPTVKQHVGIYTSNLSSIAPQAKRTQLALQRNGFAVKDFQEQPTSIANWRPYVSVSEQAGTQLLYGTGIPSFSPLYAGMNDIGYKPKFVLFSPENYRSTVSDAYAAATDPPTTHVYSNFVPFELADSNAAAKQAVSILTTTSSRKKLSAFNQLSLTAWLLWAKSATACGSDLTVKCVLAKAGANPEWTAGGLQAPVNTDPAKLSYSDCALLLKVTKSGFEYDRAATAPNDGLFNCDPMNLVDGLPTF
jgi:hypothetical protein